MGQKIKLRHEVLSIFSDTFSKNSNLLLFGIGGEILEKNFVNEQNTDSGHVM